MTRIFSIGVELRIDYSAIPDCRPELHPGLFERWRIWANESGPWKGKGARGIEIHTPLIELFQKSLS